MQIFPSDDLMKISSNASASFHTDISNVQPVVQVLYVRPFRLRCCGHVSLTIAHNGLNCISWVRKNHWLNVPTLL